MKLREAGLLSRTRSRLPSLVSTENNSAQVMIKKSLRMALAHSKR